LLEELVELEEEMVVLSMRLVLVKVLLYNRGDVDADVNALLRSTTKSTTRRVTKKSVNRVAVDADIKKLI
jgi:hypothetical protein